MTRQFTRGGSWQHIDKSEVNSKLKARCVIPCCGSARQEAIGKLSLENSSNQIVPPPAFAARGTVLIADGGNWLLFQVDCSLRHLIQCGDGRRVGLVAAAGQS